MDCCDPDLYDDQFDDREAKRKVREYRERGPNGWTTRLVAELSEGGIDGLTVIDIGAGVGAVHHALLASGAASATDVDASSAYLEAARQEAERLGLADRVTYRKGDAVRVVPELPPADLVALRPGRVVYRDMEGLVGVAAARTKRRLGLVMPRDGALIRPWSRSAIAGAP